MRPLTDTHPVVSFPHRFSPFLTGNIAFPVNYRTARILARLHPDGLENKKRMNRPVRNGEKR